MSVYYLQNQVIGPSYCAGIFYTPGDYVDFAGTSEFVGRLRDFFEDVDGVALAGAEKEAFDFLGDDGGVRVFDQFVVFEVDVV